MKKNDFFAEIAKNLVGYRSENNFVTLLLHKNNYVGLSSIMSNIGKKFDILVITACTPYIIILIYEKIIFKFISVSNQIFKY